MIVRFTGATLGLLAFSVAILGGLWADNPTTVVLSRAIWSLVVFCVLGLALGAVAQAVVDEYARRRLDSVHAESEAQTPASDGQEEASDADAEATQATQ
jgi:hypothetical protein